MSRLYARLILAGAIAGTVLAAAPAPATATASQGPGYHQPKVGSCHNLSLREFDAKWVPAGAVPCSKKHTTRTLVVKRLTGPVDWSRTDIFRPIWLSCQRQVLRVLGGNDKARALSSYVPSYFTPTPAERAAGATWLRCDIGLIGGRALQALPAKLKLGSAPLDDKVARCLSGPDRHLLLTVCAKSHTYRVTGGYRFRSKQYPGERALVRSVVRRCPDLVTSQRWRYSVPQNQDMWRAGHRTVICYSKTRH